MMSSGLRKSFQIHSDRKMPTVAVAGRTSGMMIFHQIRRLPAPSMRAASMTSAGIERMKPT